MSDIVERLNSWDRCYPGNINIELVVDEAAKEITRLRERLAEADEANRRVSDANEKLRRALAPFATAASHFKDECRDTLVVSIGVDVGYLRAAAAAIRESGDE